MAKFNIARRVSNGLVGASSTNFDHQLQSLASQSMFKHAKGAYPIARLTTRASKLAKVKTCDANSCVQHEQRVRIEVTGLAAGTPEDRVELMKLLIQATAEMQALIKQGPVMGYSPEAFTADDAAATLSLTSAGAPGVQA